MTLSELNTLLSTVTVGQTALPVSYLAFPADQAPEMPFIVFQETGSDNFGADNIVWHSNTRIQVDLLTRNKDGTTEEALETVLTNAGIFWERVSVYENDEACYRVTYEFEI